MRLSNTRALFVLFVILTSLASAGEPKGEAADLNLRKLESRGKGMPHSRRLGQGRRSESDTPEDNFTASSQTCFNKFKQRGPKGSMGKFPGANLPKGSNNNDSGIVDKNSAGAGDIDPGITKFTEDTEKIAKDAIRAIRSTELQKCLLTAVEKLILKTGRKEVACTCEQKSAVLDSSTYEKDSVPIPR